jgi:hypothetical protein
VLELDEQFAKFSKSEVQHFCKLEQQRKTSKPHKAPRLPCYNNSQCIASTQTVLGHQRIMRRILGHLRKKEIQGPPIKDSFGTIKEVAHQIMVVVATEVHTHSNLHTACSTIIRLTIAQKIAPYSSSPNEKWTKNPTSLHSKHTQRSQSHYAMGLTPLAIFSNLPFAFPTTSLPEKSSPSPGLLPIISLRHNQPFTTFTNFTNNISPSSAINYIPNAKQHQSSSQD